MMPPLPPDPAPRKFQRPRPTPDLPPLRATRVLDQLRQRLRLMHYSFRTEESAATAAFSLKLPAAGQRKRTSQEGKIEIMPSPELMTP